MCSDFFRAIDSRSNVPSNIKMKMKNTYKNNARTLIVGQADQSKTGLRYNNCIPQKMYMKRIQIFSEPSLVG